MRLCTKMTLSHVPPFLLNCFYLCLLLQLTLGSVFAYSSSTGSRYSNGHIQAAIHTRHSVSLKKVNLPESEPLHPGTIEVTGAVPSFVIKFNSASSKLKLFHQHEPGKVPSPKESFSEDEPHILKHSVTKPIIQEVRELIFPSRRIIQQIQPVIETIRTIVATTSKSNQGRKQSSESLFPPPSAAVESFAPSPHVKFEKTTHANFATDKVTGKLSEELEKPMPDLVLDMMNMIDNSLYNGNADLDLKYISPNGKSRANTSYNDFQNEHNLLNVQQFYKDRR